LSLQKIFPKFAGKTEQTNMKTYLVTGAAGFIGANYLKYILAKHDDIRVVVLDALTYAGNLATISKDIDNERCYFVKGNICDRSLADQLFADYKFDYIVNFAAESHVDRSIDNPQLFLQTNILGTQNLLDAARRAWVTGKDEFGYPTWRKDVRFHQVSTDEVYGSLGPEGYFTEETPLCPHSPYSASKTSADLIVTAYRDTYKMPVTITRCSNNYGPYHFPEKLIPLIIKNILEGKRLPVYGNGSNVRDWLYVEDHCKAIDLVVRKGRNGEIYNVGGHNEKQNIEIVKLTIETIRRLMTEEPAYRKVLKKKELDANGNISIDWINDSLITFVKDRLGHDQRYAIDPTKITNELGWYPETKFEDGIVKTIIWYLNNQEWVNSVTSGDYQNYYENMYKNR
jgi:dTDP-glucose 4,6-dehydratase